MYIDPGQAGPPPGPMLRQRSMRPSQTAAVDYRRMKPVLDAALAAPMLLLVLPVLALLAVLVALDGGPVFFRHRRVGQSGHMFWCYKLRSMRPDADAVLARLLLTDAAARAEWQERQKLRRDPRITPVGRLLRASSLDELPQLLNVLRGEMSLVGPRPVTLRELRERYGSRAEGYLSVRPGITGPWQVGGRTETSYARRVELDLGYAETLSLRGDLLLLLKTPLAVLRRRGAC